MTLKRTLLITLTLALCVGLPSDEQTIATPHALAGGGLTSMLRYLPHPGRASVPEPKEKAKTHSWMKPWESVSKWHPHWPFGAAKKTVDQLPAAARPASDTWRRLPTVKSDPPTSESISRPRPAGSTKSKPVSALSSGASIPATARRQLPDPAPRPPRSLAAANLQGTATLPEKSKQAASGAAARRVKDRARMARCTACGPGSPATRQDPATKPAKNARPETRAAGMTRSIARPVNPPRPTVGVVAATKRQPSRAALAPPRPRTATHQTRTQRTKTQRDVLPTTLAKTRVVPASKPASKTNASLTDAMQPRYTYPRTYPRTYRKPDPSASSPAAPVIDVATYRASLLGQTHAIRNISSTSSVAGVPTAPAGTWLATYQQLVRHNSNNTPAQSGPSSRRHKTNR